MRLTPINILLLVLLAGLLALDRGLGGDERQVRPIERLFPELYRDRAARALLVHKEQRVALERGADGRWAMTDQHGYPASPRKIDELLNALTSLTNLDLVTRDPASHAEYGLGPDALTAEVWDAEGRTLASLVQGSEVPQGGASYVRRADEAQVYRAPRLRAIDLAERFWLDVGWMPFEQALVHEVRAGGTLLEQPVTFTRDDGTVDRWRLQGGSEVPVARVKALARAALSLFIDGVEGPADAAQSLGPPSLELNLGLIDGRALQATFWQLPGGRGALAQQPPPLDFVVRFSPASWNLILNAARELAALR